MRVVADTNIVVSGLLWHGAPRKVLDASRANMISLFTSAELLTEMEEVLREPKLQPRLRAAEVTSRELLLGYASLAAVVSPAKISPVVRDDPDDDEVLACAVAARAEVIVTGDKHLLALRQYQNIEIITANELLARLERPHEAKE